MTNAVPGESQTPAVVPPNGDTSAAAAGNTNANGAPPEGGSDQDRNWKNLRGDRDYWRDRATQLETAQPRQPQNATPPANETPPTKKTLADFGYDEAKYDDYLAERATEVARKTVREELTADEQRKAAEARRNTYESRATEFAKANPTYHEAVTNPRFTQSDALIGEIMESANGPALALYLANNLDETNKLNRMTPVQVAREVARLEAKLANAAPPVPKNQVPAGDPPPNPPAKLEGSGDPGIKKDPAKLTDSEWWANRNKGKSKK
ncbi:MAG: hypothetical protein ACREB0_07545 [Sphingopyxis sp.]